MCEKEEKMKDILADELENNGLSKENKYLQKIIDEQYEVKDVTYKDMYNKSGRNNYKELEPAKDKIGVYLFYYYETKEFVYVGESNTKSKENKSDDLKERLTKHLTEGNGGGFPLQIQERNKGKAKDIIEEFSDNDLRILFITLDNPREVMFLESLLIGILTPKYNFYI